MNRSTLLFFPLWFLAAATPAGSGQDAEVLAQAHRYQLEFRAGNYEVVKPLRRIVDIRRLVSHEHELTSGKEGPRIARSIALLIRSNRTIREIASLIEVLPLPRTHQHVRQAELDSRRERMTLAEIGIRQRVGERMSQEFRDPSKITLIEYGPGQRTTERLQGIGMPRALAARSIGTICGWMEGSPPEN